VSNAPNPSETGLNWRFPAKPTKNKKCRVSAAVEDIEMKFCKVMHSASPRIPRVENLFFKFKMTDGLHIKFCSVPLVPHCSPSTVKH